jgi:hypothetical protein
MGALALSVGREPRVRFSDGPRSASPINTSYMSLHVNFKVGNSIWLDLDGATPEMAIYIHCRPEEVG